jgi:hypothetical protein
MYKVVVLCWTCFVLVPAVAAAQTPAFEPVADAGSRLFFGPTGRVLPPGESYFSLVGIGLPSVQVGVTDWFSMGAGTALLMPGRVVTLTPKVRLAQHGDISVAFGLFHSMFFGHSSAGAAYIAMTRGTTDGAFTIGIIRPYHGLWDGSVILIGGEARAGRRVRFITENYWMPESLVTFTGVRVHRARYSTDVGLVGFLFFGEGMMVGPALNMTWRFGDD